MNATVYLSTIKMKPLVVKENTYIDFDVENQKRYLKIQVGNYARISNYKSIFA